MNKNSALTLVVLFAGVLLSGSNGQPENPNVGFNIFLKASLLEYPAWLIRNNLDPTTSTHSPILLNRKLGLINTTGQISDVVVFNHSQIYNDFTEITTDLLSGSFRIKYFPNAMVLSGTYQVEGDVLTAFPIRGSGQFTARPEFAYPFVDVKVEGFSMTSAGYISLSTAFFNETIDLGSGKFFTNFEGLTIDARFEEDVNAALKGYFETGLPFQNIFPLVQYLKSYLEEIFAANHIRDIIETGNLNK